VASNAEELPCNALRLLESGRGVIAGMLMEMPSDISKLKGKHSKLAKKFEELRRDLDKPAT
jgi:hypothetical protein